MDHQIKGFLTNEAYYYLRRAGAIGRERWCIFKSEGSKYMELPIVESNYNWYSTDKPTNSTFKSEKIVFRQIDFFVSRDINDIFFNNLGLWFLDETSDIEEHAVETILDYMAHNILSDSSTPINQFITMIQAYERFKDENTQNGVAGDTRGRVT